MSLSKQKEEELRKEWKEKCIRTRFFTDEQVNFGTPIWPNADKILDFMLSKLSSTLEEERERVMKWVEDIKYKDGDGPRVSSWNAALSDVLEFISEGE